MHRFAKLRKLTLDDWGILLGSLVLLPHVAPLLRQKGYAEIKKSFLMQGMRHTILSHDEQVRTARRISRLVDAAANHGFYRATCLKRSLVLGWFLQRRGIPFELRIGARKDLELDGKTQRFSAHAWVESNGVVINDHDDVNDRFTSFEKRLQGQA